MKLRCLNPGNTNWKGRHGTSDLLSKLACFAWEVREAYQYKVAILIMLVQGDQLYWAFIPLKLVFPAEPFQLILWAEWSRCRCRLRCIKLSSQIWPVDLELNRFQPLLFTQIQGITMIKTDRLAQLGVPTSWPLIDTIDLYYKSFTIVIYDRNDSNQYYKTTIRAEAKLSLWVLLQPEA